MELNLVCARCQAPLVPAMSGLRCPRMTACGRGGFVETSLTSETFAFSSVRDTGVRA